MSTRARVKVSKKKTYPNKDLKKLADAYSKNDIMKIYTSFSSYNFNYLLSRYNNIKTKLEFLEKFLDPISVPRQKKHKKLLIKDRLNCNYVSINNTTTFMTNPKPTLDSYNLDVNKFLVYVNIKDIFTLEEELAKLKKNYTNLVDLPIEHYTINLTYMIIKIPLSDKQLVKNLNKHVTDFIDALCSPFHENEKMKERSTEFIVKALSQIFVDKPNTRELFTGIVSLLTSELESNYKSYLMSQDRLVISITILFNVVKDVKALLETNFITETLISNAYKELKDYGIIPKDQLEAMKKHKNTNKDFSNVLDVLNVVSETMSSKEIEECDTDLVDIVSAFKQ